VLRSLQGRAAMPDDADDRRQEAMLAEAETLMTKAEAMLLTRGERWTQLRLRRVAVDQAMAEYTAWREVVMADPALDEAQKLEILSRYLRGPR
jgi:hypothetical protein